MHWFRSLAAAGLVIPLLAACGDDSSGPATGFLATLSGSEEVPPVLTTATGSASFSVASGQLTYTINVANVQNAVVAHIHIAPQGQNGPVRLNLCGTGDPVPPCTSGSGILAQGTSSDVVNGPGLATITFDDVVEAMRTGNAYINIHTDDGAAPPNTGQGDMASGEIRGQIRTE